MTESKRLQDIIISHRQIHKYCKFFRMKKKEGERKRFLHIKFQYEKVFNKDLTSFAQVEKLCFGNSSPGQKEGKEL